MPDRTGWAGRLWQKRLPALAAACALMVGCSGAPRALPPAPVPTATVVPPISLPADAGAHDVLTEWWYYTGHLQSAASDSGPFGTPAHGYGFEYTIFQVQRAGEPTGYLAHFAVTDVDGQRFSHQAQATTGAFQPGFNLDVQGWTLANDGAEDVLSAAMTPGPGADPPFALNLKLADEKPPALHNGGYIDYGAAGGSYYYSRTRLRVSGSLQDASTGETSLVSGQAWMDHQWGNFVLASGGGWDWYSLQLNDQTEVMLYVLRDAAGTSGVYGTQVLADGTAREIQPNSVSSEATGEWTSPHTGAVYPSGWRISLPGQAPLLVQPEMQDQELYFPGSPVPSPVYWEGAVDLRTAGEGSPVGVGYVELTGYAPERAGGS